MGDLNFPASEVTWQMVEGVLHPRVAGFRTSCDKEDQGGQVRQQAARLFSLAEKYHLTQQVGLSTRGKEILDLMWTSNPDLISNIVVDTFRDISDHSVVTAATSYRLRKEAVKDEQFLLESGKKLRHLDFSKAPWPTVRAKLAEPIAWGDIISFSGWYKPPVKFQKCS